MTPIHFKPNEPVILSLKDLPVENAPLRQEAYRRAASKLHPDVPGGSHDDFVKLQAALALLEGK